MSKYKCVMCCETASDRTRKHYNDENAPKGKLGAFVCLLVRACVRVVCVWVRAYVCVRTHVLVCARECPRMRVSERACVRACACMCVRACVRACVFVTADNRQHIRDFVLLHLPSHT